ncbi:33687_t:CDS:1, partial [Gigaspora margarita]
SGSSDICQEKDNRSSTSSETNSNDTFEDKEIKFLERVHKEQIRNEIRERNREKKLLQNNETSTFQDQELIQKSFTSKIDQNVSKEPI